MKLVKNPYTVSKVSGTSDTWYCHHKDYPYIPVFESIGDKKKHRKFADFTIRLTWRLRDEIIFD